MKKEAGSGGMQKECADHIANPGKEKIQEPKIIVEFGPKRLQPAGQAESGVNRHSSMYRGKMSDRLVFRSFSPFENQHACITFALLTRLPINVNDTLKYRDVTESKQKDHDRQHPFGQTTDSKQYNALRSFHNTDMT